MYEYLKGEIIELNPTYLVLENSGIGYFIHISVNTYSKLAEQKTCLVYIHQAIREDAHVFFGFADKKEREIFLQLISVSGIGANTARMMLSSLSPEEVKSAILQNNISLLKSIKGIGLKTAERIIVDLRDKVGKITDESEIVVTINNTIKDEALSALVMLGFPKAKIEKLLSDILKDHKSLSVEELVKESLKRI
ncbi:MAG: Holliday junction branch migration protein RuvA [Bacteroidales bacterium]|jgi:Holliday junction DNA helicase RuvA|nr:Holliday junction branch migration protein RuvA [Bacteroidales bacterium]